MGENAALRGPDNRSWHLECAGSCEERGALQCAMRSVQVERIGRGRCDLNQ